MTRLLSTGLLIALLAAPAASAQIHSTLVASGLTTPIAMVKVPGMANTFLVAEQGGRIRVLQNGAILATDFLNLIGQIVSGGEQGLLGLALAPDYVTSGRFWVNFTNPAGHTVIARFTRSAANPLVANVASRFDLVWPNGQPFITQPFANHNGGNIMFGPDGFLYIGMGDGGSGDDPNNNAQNPASLLGKMLRIDVMVPNSDPQGYDVPPTNPFVGVTGYLPEIWDVGMRNPWRWSFDDPAHGGTGALVIGDVGQNRFEEIDYEPAGHGGRNYGWSLREGAHDEVTSISPAFLPLIDPMFEYGRTEGVTVTGGYVYRGAALGAAYVGRYFFADFGFSRVWSLALTINPVTHEATASGRIDHTGELGSVQNPSSFATDDAGELYLLSYSTGQIYRIDPGGSGPPPPPPPNTCTTPDPFVALGGGTCFNGGWYPPTIPAPQPSPQTPPPPVTGGCTTPDPFTAMGGGTCLNGGWYPPNGAPAPAPTTPPTTTPPPPPPPPPTGGCTTPNPFVAFGAGVCVNGGWQFGPATTPAPPPSPPPTPPPSSGGCTTPDPFISIPGLIGVCINGGWYPVIR